MSGQQQRDRFENYVPVAERVEQFYNKFPQGRILTTILEHDRETGFILIRAEAYRQIEDELPAATGHAFENRGEGYVNKTSYVENCETGAVGRALALLGFEVKRGIASREEMQKAERQVPTQIKTAPGVGPVQAVEPASELPRLIHEAADALGYDQIKVRKWVNQKYEITTGIDGLTEHDQRAVLKMFREQAPKVRRA